jgi:hypothetical protein
MQTIVTVIGVLARCMYIVRDILLWNLTEHDLTEHGESA